MMYVMCVYELKEVVMLESREIRGYLRGFMNICIYFSLLIRNNYTVI